MFWKHKKVLLCLASMGLFIIFMYNSSPRFVRQSKRYCSKRRHYNVSFINRLEPDIDKYTSQLIAGVEPDLPPINRYDHKYIILNTEKCLSNDGCGYNIRLLLIVKSAIGNIERRNAIRQTWGWEQRFPDVVIRCVFNLGLARNNPPLQQQVEKEQSQYGDIIQGNFTDAYKNNTIKSMLGFRWVIENCPTAKFIMFVDDDMYMSTKNALQYANRPDNYPNYLQTNHSEITKLQGNYDVFKFDLSEPPASFFAGRTKYNDPPVRGRSPWKITLSEYPFAIYPPYVPAGAYILSFQTLRKMYYTSMYTPHFLYDDVYIGMLAKRAGIEPLTNNYFIFGAKPVDFKYVIAVHGYSNATALICTWKEQFRLQNA